MDVVEFVVARGCMALLLSKASGHLLPGFENLTCRALFISTSWLAAWLLEASRFCTSWVLGVKADRTEDLESFVARDVVLMLIALAS